MFTAFKKIHFATFKSRIKIVLGSVFIAFTHAVTSVSGHVPAATMSLWDGGSSAGCGRTNAVSFSVIFRDPISCQAGLHSPA